MEMGATLNAVNSGDALKQAIGIAMLNKVQDVQTAQTATLLQDFVAAQHPYLGKSLDISV